MKVQGGKECLLDLEKKAVVLHAFLQIFLDLRGSCLEIGLNLFPTIFALLFVYSDYYFIIHLKETIALVTRTSQLMSCTPLTLVLHNETSISSNLNGCC